ncbi:MAG TPA: hypothetical protein VHB20_11880 [Verrucomicrobiae bacterium]|jgi:hypothetical protein|nr:hypothetical protein [Verrucomicrobiae bacterium]
MDLFPSGLRPARLFFLALSVIGRAHGATVAARSMSHEDVASAVESARDGDTVVVPAGRTEWRSTLVVDKAIALRFAGIGQSVIADDVMAQRPDGNPPWSEGVITFNTKPGKFYRLTGLEIDRGAARTNIYFRGSVQMTGGSAEFRIDHCALTQVLDNGIYIGDSACGVIDHCLFNMQGGQHGVLVTHKTWRGESYGDGSWSSPAGWGGPGAVYIEDCVFTNGTARPWWAVDSWAGARWVFRHNQVFNANITTHGTESGGLDRGTRTCEVYQNQFYDANVWPNAVELRSASAVLWSNTASGQYRTFCSIDDYRCGDNYNYWGAADGLNPLDKNEPGPALVATHAGPNGSPQLVVAGAQWKENQWAGYSVIDVSEPGITNFGTVSSNLANVVGFIPAARHPHVVFNTGDTVKFYKVIAALDMPGMGQSDPLRRDKQGHPVGRWPNQQIEPIYSWNNTLNGADAGVTTRNALMQAGIHYLNNTPKPGYAPFTYPHPLALAP